MSETENLPQPEDTGWVKLGRRVRVKALGSTEGMTISAQHLAPRAVGVEGSMMNPVPGHGGDVWFVIQGGMEDEDGFSGTPVVGAYVLNELEPIDYYPEHEKLQEISDKSQAIGEFLEEMSYKGIRLCEFNEDITTVEQVEVPEDLERWLGEDDTDLPLSSHNTARALVRMLAGRDHHQGGFMPVAGTTMKILEGYFGIDGDKVEDEKRQMLDKIREANAA